MATKTLIDLFQKYESFDNVNGTDKNTNHSYGDLYQERFDPLRTSAKHVLEIGVFSGASTLVWAEFFENAHIDGVDITLERVKFGNDNSRISYYEMDGTVASTAEALCADGKRYDLIIDDGSHFPDHQVKSLDVFAPYLADGGLYVIEDIDERYADTVRTGCAECAERHGLIMEWLDLRKNKNRFDDIVAIFTKKRA